MGVCVVIVAECEELRGSLESCVVSGMGRRTEVGERHANGWQLVSEVMMFLGQDHPVGHCASSSKMSSSEGKDSGGECSGTCMASYMRRGVSFTALLAVCQLNLHDEGDPCVTMSAPLSDSMLRV